MPKVVTPDQPDGKLVIAHDMSAPLSSPWFDLLYFQVAFIEASWEGVEASSLPAGRMWLEGANTRERGGVIPASEVDIATESDVQAWNMWIVPGRFVRFCYLPEGITAGTMNVTVSARATN